jgi:5-methylcytosine-specific restriction endonuclease McrA
MVTQPRKGRPRRRALDEVRRRGERCHLCRLPIVQGVNSQTHPLRLTVDELIPVSHGGSTTDPANLAPACACCNSSRGNRPLTPAVYAACLKVSMHHRARLNTNGASNPRW